MKQKQIMAPECDGYQLWQRWRAIVGHEEYDFDDSTLYLLNTLLLPTKELEITETNPHFFIAVVRLIIQRHFNRYQPKLLSGPNQVYSRTLSSKIYF